MKAAVLLLLAFLVLTMSPDVRAGGDEPLGVWVNQNGTLRVRFSPCGVAFCGSIVWMKDPHDDSFNPDPSKRRASLIGTRLYSGMMPSGNINEWKGTAYNPDNGRNYTQTLFLRDANTIASYGCVTGSQI